MNFYGSPESLESQSCFQPWCRATKKALRSATGNDLFPRDPCILIRLLNGSRGTTGATRVRSRAPRRRMWNATGLVCCNELQFATEIKHHSTLLICRLFRGQAVKLNFHVFFFPMGRSPDIYLLQLKIKRNKTGKPCCNQHTAYAVKLVGLIQA